MRILHERPTTADLDQARPLFTTPEGIEVTGVPLTGLPAAERRRAVLAARSVTSCWPVLIDQSFPAQLEFHWTLPDITMPLHETLRRAARLCDGDPDGTRPDFPGPPVRDVQDPPVAGVPSRPDGFEPLAPTLLGGVSRAYLALMPVDAGWQVPALLNYGGWNRYPSPVEHTVVLRRLYERYGAELVAMTDCSAEFIVRRPPLTRPDAWHLAWELIGYSDVVRDRSPESAVRFAADLLGADHWVASWR
ncbi:DUF4253 domain-containing protein [Nonomuraea sp. NN258]|uniref:DUF4253 domain-containing protein n=1 Tax=Nonomuraea antri TaxID=2730852 RepID=UPI00156A1F56|nr:DUF4253 domain-containing protein [Nonomuraea antri]NRQ35164.1 DUF4253 domain-containing protein [Nonomuraea antri]